MQHVISLAIPQTSEFPSLEFKEKVNTLHIISLEMSRKPKKDVYIFPGSPNVAEGFSFFLLNHHYVRV